MGTLTFREFFLKGKPGQDSSDAQCGLSWYFPLPLMVPLIIWSVWASRGFKCKSYTIYIKLISLGTETKNRKSKYQGRSQTAELSYNPWSFVLFISVCRDDTDWDVTNPIGLPNSSCSASSLRGHLKFRQPICRQEMQSQARQGLRF